jgi:hypothetical protein
MFIREGQRFTAKDDYRDDALLRKALELAQRGPLIITGLAGIGKSWFLRRLATLAGAKQSRHFRDDGAPFTRPLGPLGLSDVEAYDARADGAGALAETLVHRLKRPDPRRLLLIDGIEALLDHGNDADIERGSAARSLVEAISRYPEPLVMTAPPRVLSIAPLGRCRSLVLPPLSPPERRALLLQTCDPGAGLDGERAAIGLDATWGGHPRVLQQVGALLREAPGATLPQLVEVVSERLSGYGPAIAASVTAIEQEALLAVTWDEGISERLRGAALSLTLHGALLRQSDGWVLENLVLARALAHEPR